MSAKARQQSATLANPACQDLLIEELPSLIPSVYGHYERAIGSSLMPMFHMLCIPIKPQNPSPSLGWPSRTKRSRGNSVCDRVRAAHMLSSRFGYSLAIVSIKLHFQVRLSVESAFQHCDGNSEVPA